MVVFGIVIGQNALADAYDGANNSPNSIYELLIGGVLSATLVPLFTSQLEDDDEEATNAVVSVAAIFLAAVTAAAVVAAPLIFRLFALTPDPSVDAGQYRSVGTALARIFLIQIFFYGLMALGSSLLQARRRFFAPAWAPIIANLVTIGFLLAIPRVIDRPGPVAGPGQRRRRPAPAPQPGRHRRHRADGPVARPRAGRGQACACGSARPGGTRPCASSSRCRGGRSATWSPTRWR